LCGGLVCFFRFGLVFELRGCGRFGVVFGPEMFDLGEREGRALLEACDEGFEAKRAVRLGSHGGMVGAVTFDRSEWVEAETRGLGWRGLEGGKN